MNSLPASNFKTYFVELFREAASNISTLDNLRVELMRTKNVNHGDYSCNLAMHLAKPLGRNPREIAQLLIDNMPISPYVEKIEIAGGGFINLFLKDSVKQQYLYYVLQGKEAFGESNFGQRKKIQVEFVSANPTGPLHVGHGRGAAIGASLANILEAAGFDVSREFYVNDAGRQMDILTASTWLRYLELNDTYIPFPLNAYQGDYVKTMAHLIHQTHAQRYVHQPYLLWDDLPVASREIPLDTDEQLDQLIENIKKVLGQDYRYIHNFVLTEQLGDCRNDLMEFSVEFDVWFSEQSLYDNGLVEYAVGLLEKKHYLYKQDGAMWFRSTNFGDEKDRVVQRENGQFTYFASDIAYHLNKFQRGFDQIINIWGADHHGYIARLRGALQALELDSSKLEIALVQFAILYRNGKRVSMSTRSGEFVTLRELREEVGKDAARFFYVMRKSDQHLDFDLDLAKSQSADNPVYYIQYAHARVCSVLAQWDGNINDLIEADKKALSSPAELALLQRIIDFPDVIEAAAREYSPHLIAFYLRELASEFHSYYNSTRFLVPEILLLHSRLALITAIGQILNNGLRLLGVSAPAKM